MAVMIRLVGIGLPDSVRLVEPVDRPPVCSPVCGFGLFPGSRFRYVSVRNP
jgi:hypothetical protein